MLNLNFTPFPTLTTERLVLGSLTPNDVDEVYFLRSDEVVLRYIDRPRAKSKDEAAQWIALNLDRQSNNELILWSICIKDQPKLIGTIGYFNLQTEHCRAEIGYVMYPQYHRQGIMNEALREVLKYGLETMNLHSIEANVNPLNIASMKLLEKNGFVREGYFRENFYFNGKFLDSAVYSLVAQPRSG